MKKRLAKKFRQGDYRELGFYVTYTIDSDTDEEVLLDEILEMIESRELEIGGTTNSFFVTGSGDTRTSRTARPTEDDRKYVETWLLDKGMSDVKVWEMTDAWYGPFDWELSDGMEE